MLPTTVKSVKHATHYGQQSVKHATHYGQQSVKHATHYGQQSDFVINFDYVMLTWR
jgi:hypothetical protein